MTGTHAREQGQVLVIVVVALLVILIFASIAIDLASAYVHRRTDQNAADAAALAAAMELARQQMQFGAKVGIYGSETAILATMNDFAERNGVLDTDGVAANPINTNVVGYYLGSDRTRLSETTVGSLGVVLGNARGVEVIADSIAPSFFSRVIGIDNIPVSALAAAEYKLRDHFIWAHSDHCYATIDWSGSNLDVTGWVHTNNDLKMGGSNNAVSGDTEWVSSTDISGSDNDLNLSHVPYDPNWPVWFNIDDFAPGGPAANAAGGDYHYVPGDMWDYIELDQGDELHGLYYVDGEVKLDKSDLWGEVTIVATGWIFVAGSDHHFTPYFSGGTDWDDLLFFSNKRHSEADKRCVEDVLEISGSNSHYEGTVFAPRGKVQYSGSNHTVIEGSIVADTITFNGSNSDLAGGHQGLPLVRLIR